MSTYVYDFAEGGRDMADLLGGKGANLAEMARMGLPVPPGFTITAEACRVFLATGEPPAELDREVGEHLRRWNGRPASGWGRWTTRCCCRSGRGRGSPCRA